MPIAFSPEQIKGMMRAIKETGFYDPSQYPAVLESLKNWTLNRPGQGANIPISVKHAKEAIQTGQWGALATILKTIAPTMLAGAATAGAWAIPAKKAGEEIGWRMEEKRAGKRLRPVQPPLKETAKYIPRAIMAGIRKKIKRQ
jgi:hypothetical protein